MHDNGGGEICPPFLPRTANKNEMGAAKTHSKTQVAFAYLIADTYVSVVANVHPGNYAQVVERRPTESEIEAQAEIVSAAYRWQGKTVAWDDIPAFIAADIEAHALEVWRKTYC